MTSEQDPRDELAAITASVRAYVEWQMDTGASGTPRGARTRPAAAVAAPAPSPAPAPVPPLQAPPVKSPLVEIARMSTEPGPAEAPPVAADAPAPAPASELVGDAVRAPVSLPVLAAEVASCTKCGLSQSRNKTVFSRGNPDAKLVFVGEGPGAEEDASGLPFVGRAGQLLDKMIAAMGLDPERDVYICNIVKCRPPGNRNPEPDEIEACLPYLHAQLETVKPKAIVALGNVAVQALLGTKIGITKMRGEWKLYKRNELTTLVMPTYHPSYLIRPSAQQLEAKRQAWDDLQAVMKELGIAKKPKA